MMTKMRKRRLQQKIQESRGRLMRERPFFALLLMYLRFVAVPGMDRISTDGERICFSPDFLDKLHAYELDYILCHQIMHIALGHIWRRSGLAGDEYHLACDIQINLQFEKEGFLRDSYPHLGHVYRKVYARQGEELSAEEIYARLPIPLYLFDGRTRSRYLCDSDALWEGGKNVCGEVILDAPQMDAWLREEKRKEEEDEPDGVRDDRADQETGASAAKTSSLKIKASLREEWAARIAFAAGTMASCGRQDDGAGAIPGFARRMLAKMTAPTVDWKKTLNEFIQERVCDYSFSPPDRRFADTDFFLPDFSDRAFISREILFMADTSGSVDDRELAVVYSEIRGAIEQFGGKLTGSLGFFDAAVTLPQPFGSVAELMKIIPRGGGGTDFRVIFDYIRRLPLNDLPACVVIFTDGRGPYPQEQDAMGLPVLWMVNNFDVTPPWGRVTRVVGAQERRK